jgi:hypothetical protein
VACKLTSDYASSLDINARVIGDDDAVAFAGGFIFAVGEV